MNDIKKSEPALGKKLPEEIKKKIYEFRKEYLPGGLKESIIIIVRNCFAPMTLDNMRIHNKWEAGYKAIGKALKEVLESC